MNRKATRIAAIALLSLLFSSFMPAWAESAQVDYGTGVGQKLARGLGNVAFGWLEILKGIQDVGDQRNFIAGITLGPLQGVGNALVRTVAGAYEVATFPIPLPSNFEPLLKPDFVLEDQR